jgi:hypothetical protein
MDEDVPHRAQMGRLADRVPGFSIQVSFVRMGSASSAALAAAGVLRDRYML